MHYHADLKGLRGWLILVGIGVIVTPIRILVSFESSFLPLFSDEIWETLTTVAPEASRPLFGLLLLVENAFNASLLLTSLYLIYLFFAKHYLFPKVFIAFTIASLVFTVLDAWFTSFVFPNLAIFDSGTIKDISFALIRMIIWVPYMLLSKRVNATFVEKRGTLREIPVT